MFGQIGDHVRLLRGKTGVVRFIGPTDFSHEELVGIELDAWSVNTHDGSVKGRQYFKV